MPSIVWHYCAATATGTATTGVDYTIGSVVTIACICSLFEPEASYELSRTYGEGPSQPMGADLRQWT